MNWFLILRIYLSLTPKIISETQDDLAENPNFNTAYDLLCANVISLCLRVGLRPIDLFPPQSIVMNLRVLKSWCRKQMSYYNTTFSSLNVELSSYESDESVFPLTDLLSSRYSSLRSASSLVSHIRLDSDWLLIDSDKS